MLTTDGTKIIWKGRHGAKGSGTPRRRHTYQNVDVNVMSLLHKVGLWDASSKVLLLMEGRGVLQDLTPEVASWNLLMFLLRDGSLTLMYKASLIILGNIVCLLMHYWENVHADAMTWGIHLVIDGGSWGVSLKLSPKVLANSPMYSSFHSMGTPKPVDYPTCLSDLIHILEGDQEVADGADPLKVYLESCIATYILKAFTKPLV